MLVLGPTRGKAKQPLSGKLSAPLPINLPSKKSETGALEDAPALVSSSGIGWGKQQDEEAQNPSFSSSSHPSMEDPLLSSSPPSPWATSNQKILQKPSIDDLHTNSFTPSDEPSRFQLARDEFPTLGQNDPNGHIRTDDRTYGQASNIRPSFGSQSMFLFDCFHNVLTSYLHSVR